MGVFLSVEPRGFSITQVKSLYKTLMKSEGLLNPPINPRLLNPPYIDRNPKAIMPLTKGRPLYE